ncbi:hypothetical protein MMC16_006037 [Acarospora aff. strigata]|nr:hypothetical protein [Acarospora aff. strigata]
MALDSEPRQSPNFNLDENAAWEELKQIDYIIITFTNPEEVVKYERNSFRSLQIQFLITIHQKWLVMALTEAPIFTEYYPRNRVLSTSADPSKAPMVSVSSVETAIRRPTGSTRGYHKRLTIAI